MDPSITNQVLLMFQNTRINPAANSEKPRTLRVQRLKTQRLRALLAVSSRLQPCLLVKCQQALAAYPPLACHLLLASAATIAGDD